MSKRRNSGNQTNPPIVEDVEYEGIEDLERDAEEESDTSVPEPQKEEKKGFLNAVGGVAKKTGKVLLGVAIVVGGSLAVGYLMSRQDRPEALEEGEVEYYDFGETVDESEKEEYPGD